MEVIHWGIKKIEHINQKVNLWRRSATPIHPPRHHQFKGQIFFIEKIIEILTFFKLMQTTFEAASLYQSIQWVKCQLCQFQQKANSQLCMQMILV